jgi:hypothetical protein
MPALQNAKETADPSSASQKCESVAISARRGGLFSMKLGHFLIVDSWRSFSCARWPAGKPRRLRAALDLRRWKSELRGVEKWKHFSGLRHIELRQRGGLVGHDDALGRVGPFAGCADAAVGAQGADDGVSANVNIFYLLEDVLENELHVSSPKLVKARGAGVAIDGRAVVERVAGGDAIGIEPVDEVLVDLLAVLVIADGAFGLVALEIRERFRVVRRGGGSLVADARFGAVPSLADGPSTARRLRLGGRFSGLRGRRSVLCKRRGDERFRVGAGWDINRYDGFGPLGFSIFVAVEIVGFGRG